ncbi:uL30 family ribosomal protein [Pseudarthrobacter sp. S9]|uniref:uL30 family ribosomal protein n=1 Tax=Pseudarthrobacter sp. S9 TaxID=3418421 RepID=UPI003D082859
MAERRKELRVKLQIPIAALCDIDQTKVSGSRLTSFGGDVCLVQKRSTIGSTRCQKANIRHLGLRGINSSAVISRDDAAAFGRIRKVQHLLKIVELPGFVPKGKYRLTIRQGGMTMLNENSGDANGKSEISFINRNEYLSVETVDGGVSALWTSGLSADIAVDLMASRAGAPLLNEVGLIGVHEDGETRTGRGTPADILEYVHSETSNVEFFRIPFQNFDIFWSSHANGILEDSESMTEVAVIGPSVDRRTITALLSETGSKSISANPGAIATKIKLMNSL